MKFANLNPELIGTWFPPGVNWEPEKIKSLSTLVKENGWNNIPIVPVYELSNKVKSEHKYILADGHKKRLIASKLGIQLPSAVYQPDEIINSVRDHLDPFEFFRNPDGSEHYMEILRLYQDPSIVERWIIKKGKSKWDKEYLEKLIL